MLKLLVVGPPQSGKSSLISRFVHNQFSGEHLPTTSFDYSNKAIQIENGEIKLQIWEIVSNDQFGGINKLFCKDAVGVLVVIDINDDIALEEAENWRKSIDDHARLPNGEPIPMTLIGSKTDLQVKSSQISSSLFSDQSLEEKATLQGFMSSQKVSAKDGTGVKEAFGNLVRVILQNDFGSLVNQEQEDQRSLSANSHLMYRTTVQNRYNNSFHLNNNRHSKKQKKPLEHEQKQCCQIF